MLVLQLKASMGENGLHVGGQAREAVAGCLYGMAPARDVRTTIAACSLCSRRAPAGWDRETRKAPRRRLSSVRSKTQLAGRGRILFQRGSAGPMRAPPEWPLDQLLAWLHGVLNFVVREEHSRASHRREVLLGGIAEERSSAASGGLDPADPAPDQLDTLIQKEMQQIVVECLPALGPRVSRGLADARARAEVRRDRGSAGHQRKYGGDLGQPRDQNAVAMRSEAHAIGDSRRADSG